MEANIDNAKDGNDYVGLWSSENGELIIRFPIGYNRSTESNRDDISTLIRLMEKSKKSGSLKIDEGDEKNFPIYDYLNVIDYFVNHNYTYYRETETIFERRDSGKISWSKTIRKVKPLFDPDSGQALYIDTIRKCNTPNDSNLITLINKYCVYESILLFGGLYNLPLPEKPFEYNELKEEEEYLMDYLKKKIAQTNVDTTKSLFNSMLAILRRNHEQKDSNLFTFRTKEFHVIWETIVDDVLGTEHGSQKSRFYPYVTWNFLDGNGKSIGYPENTEPLKPDTIMIVENKTYVIDAKYYPFGLDLNHPAKNGSELPGPYSIYKQLYYVEYAKQVLKEEVSNITPFIIPYNKVLYSNNLMELRAKTSRGADGNFVYAVVLDTKDAIKIYLDNRHEEKISTRELLIRTIDAI